MIKQKYKSIIYETELKATELKGKLYQNQEDKRAWYAVEEEEEEEQQDEEE